MKTKYLILLFILGIGSLIFGFILEEQANNLKMNNSYDINLNNINANIQERGIILNTKKIIHKDMVHEVRLLNDGTKHTFIGDGLNYWNGNDWVRANFTITNSKIAGVKYEVNDRVQKLKFADCGKDWIVSMRNTNKGAVGGELRQKPSEFAYWNKQTQQKQVILTPNKTCVAEIVNQPTKLKDRDYVKGKIIKYKNYFGTGIDLEYVFNAGSLEQNIIFNTKPKLPPSLLQNKELILLTELNLSNYGGNILVDDKTYDYNSLSLSTAKSKNTGISFSDSAGKHLLTKSLVYDSTLHTDKEDGNEVKSEQFIKKINGKHYIIDTIDLTFFKNAKYPLVIDPTDKSGTIDSTNCNNPPLQENWTFAETGDITTTGSITISGITLFIEPGITVNLGSWNYFTMSTDSIANWTGNSTDFIRFNWNTDARHIGLGKYFKANKSKIKYVIFNATGMNDGIIYHYENVSHWNDYGDNPIEDCVFMSANKGYRMIYFPNGYRPTVHYKNNLFFGTRLKALDVDTNASQVLVDYNTIVGNQTTTFGYGFGYGGYPDKSLGYIHNNLFFGISQGINGNTVPVRGARSIAANCFYNVTNPMLNINTLAINAEMINSSHFPFSAGNCDYYDFNYTCYYLNQTFPSGDICVNAGQNTSAEDSMDDRGTDITHTTLDTGQADIGYHYFYTIAGGGGEENICNKNEYSSGNYNLNCSNNCSITYPIHITGNLTFYNKGIIYIKNASVDVDEYVINEQANQGTGGCYIVVNKPLGANLTAGGRL